MTKATVGDDVARKAPEGFNLDDFIDNGEPGWRLTPTPIELELRFFNGAGRGVTESPLAKDQTVHVDGDVVTLTATVVDTRVLRAWLLGFGPGVEVVRPTSLRSELQEAMKAAAARYK
jgi:predicted DNA-binding transcriptional regulator YafY